MELHQGLELLFVLLSAVLFAGYHLWTLWISVSVLPERRNSNMFYINRQARAAWAREVCKAQDAAAQTYIAQTLRNSITASSLLATACSLIAITGIGNIIVDSSKLNTLKQLESKDPILHGHPGLISPALKLGILEAIVLFSFLFFTQSVRLAVNISFYARNIHGDEADDFYNEDELAAISKRSATCFTLGMRIFYALIPLIFWLGGPTWMLCVTCVLVVMLYITDCIPAQRLPRKMEEEKAGDIEEGKVLKSPSRKTSANGQTSNGAAKTKDIAQD